MALRSNTIVSGHDLLAEFHDAVADISARAAERTQVVDARLAQLENERATLSLLEQRITQTSLPPAA